MKAHIYFPFIYVRNITCVHLPRKFEGFVVVGIHCSKKKQEREKDRTHTWTRRRVVVVLVGVWVTDGRLGWRSVPYRWEISEM